MMATAVVTGAGRGIGRAIGDRLTADGYTVVGLDIAEGGAVQSCDVSDIGDVERVAAEVGRVDVLVNNAGIWRHAPLTAMTSQEFEAVMRVDLTGAVHCTQVFGRPMLASGRGCVINITSLTAGAVRPGSGAFSMAKAALVALTRQTAMEWGPRGVRCNSVSPGFIRTEGTESVYRDRAASARRAALVPLRRIGDPGDVADAVSFLASSRASYINGHDLAVDGGVAVALGELLFGDASRS